MKQPNPKNLTKAQIIAILVVGFAVALNFLSQLSHPNSVYTLIDNTLIQTIAHFFSVGGILIIVILATLSALFRKPRVKGATEDIQILFKQAVKLESSHKIQEALVIYEDIAKRFPDTVTGSDAKISY